MLIMEYLPLGNLDDVHKVRTLSILEIEDVMHYLLQALAYLHNQKIIHRNIKPENILVEALTPDIIIKLSDFGLSKRASQFQTPCGTNAYAAPETVSGQYNHSVDIWSAAVVALRFVNRLPDKAEGMKGIRWAEQIRQAALSLDPMNSIAIIKLIKQMLQIAPQDRPSAKTCLQHPVFDQSQAALQDETGHIAPSGAQNSSTLEPTVILTRLLDNAQVITSRKRRKSSSVQVSVVFLSQFNMLCDIVN